MQITLSEDEIVAWLQQFVHGDPMDPIFRQRVIDIFVNSIYLYDDKVVMYFNIKDTSQVSYIEMQEDLDALGGSDLNCSGVPKQKDILTGVLLFFHFCPTAGSVVRTRLF